MSNVIHVNDNFGELPNCAIAHIVGEVHKSIHKQDALKQTFTAIKPLLANLESSYNEIIDRRQHLIEHFDRDGDEFYQTMRTIEIHKLDAIQEGIDVAMRCFNCKFVYDRDLRKYRLDTSGQEGETK